MKVTYSLSPEVKVPDTPGADVEIQIESVTTDKHGNIHVLYGPVKEEEK